MLGRTGTGLALWVAMSGAAFAQESEQVWIQLEQLPTLARAELSAEGYSEQLPDVEGFYIGSGWYAVALGPFSRAEAEQMRTRLMMDGVIPGDAVLSDGGQFQNQFFPASDATAAPADPEPEAQPVAADPGADESWRSLPDETRAEAQASEAALSRGEKEELQVWLQSAGVYDGGIDGAFGPGTRSAMARWQAAKGYEPTGILTTRERAELKADYYAVLSGLGMRTVRDEAAGIQLDLPAAVLAPPVTDAPFVRYDALEEGGGSVLLISQPGDPSRLAGLYQIMQTLEVVPTTGERQRTDSAFVIDGQDERIHSTTYAWLVDGQIKGFTLVWPQGDDERRTRLLDAMRASFRRLPGVLDPAAGPAGEDQAVDLVSGLQVRQPSSTATGFWVDSSGTLVTVAEAVAGCEEVTVDAGTQAQVALVDAARGLAVLRPEAALAPRAVAAFRDGAPRIGSGVAVAGYPYGGVIAQPALTFGTLADVRGLNGEAEVRRLDLSAQAGDAGGPVLDESGAVIGMLLPREEGSQVLPPDVSYALDAGTIAAVLAQAGVTATLSQGGPSLTPERLTRDAGGLAVLVSCW